MVDAPVLDRVTAIPPVPGNAGEVDLAHAARCGPHDRRHGNRKVRTFRLTSVVGRPLTPAYSTAPARQVKRPHWRANKKKLPLCLIQLRVGLARPRGAHMASGESTASGVTLQRSERAAF
jgi:hypothetical protein